MNDLVTQLITGIGLGFGMFYVITQFGLTEALKWRKYLDLALLLVLMYMFMIVGSGYMAGVITWAGLTISLSLRLIGLFVKR